MSARPSNLVNACSSQGSSHSQLEHEPGQPPFFTYDNNRTGAQIFGASSPLAAAVAALVKAAGFEIAGVWDADAACAQRFACKHNVAAHSSNIDTVILREQPVLNIVLAPPQYAAEIVIKSLSLDKHVLTIPPLMLDLHEAVRILRAALYAPDLIASPLFPLRALPGVARLREILSGDELGRVLAVEARVVGGRVLPSESGDHRYNKWSWDKRMLGAPLDTVMCHVIDLITCLGAAGNSRHDGIGCRIGRVTCSATDLDKILKQHTAEHENDADQKQHNFSFYCRPNAECIVMSHMLSKNQSTQFLMSLNFLYPDRPFELDVHVSCTHGRARIRREFSGRSMHETSSLVDMDGSASLMDARKHKRTGENADDDRNETFVASNGNATDDSPLLLQELLRDAASYKVVVEKYDSINGSSIDEQIFDLISSSLFAVDEESEEQTTEAVPHHIDGPNASDKDRSKPKLRYVEGLQNSTARRSNETTTSKSSQGSSSSQSSYDSFYCSALMLGGLRATLEQVKSQLTRVANLAGEDVAGQKLSQQHNKQQHQFALPSLYDGVYTMQVINALRTSCDQHDRWQNVMLPSAISADAAGATAGAGAAKTAESSLSYIQPSIHR